MSEKRMTTGFILLLVILVSAPVGHAQTNKKLDDIDIALSGSELSAEEAQKLEEKVKADPNDLESRLMLLGYYLPRAHNSESARRARRPHIFWIIKNRPASKIGGEPHVTFDPKTELEPFLEGKRLWLEQVEANPNNTTILKNTISYIFGYDNNLAEELLKKAQTLEPNNPIWSQYLSRLYSSYMKNKLPESGREMALDSLREMENALKLAKSEEARFVLLSNLAETAFAAGEMEKARLYAVELLGEAPRYKKHLAYGHVIHHGNLILGRLAIRSNDIVKAKEYLIEAGNAPSSPGIAFFGPGMILARELLETGEREVVINYFHLCATFWQNDQGKLKIWEMEVKEGRIPDFGSNLKY